MADVLANSVDRAVISGPEDDEREALIEKNESSIADVEVREDLGEVAVEHVLGQFEAAAPEHYSATPETPPDTPETAVEKADKVLLAEEAIAAAVGENLRDGGELGRALRAAGDSAEAIRQALDQKAGDPDLREKVLDVLRDRFSELRVKGNQFHERVQRDSPDNLKKAATGFGYEDDKYTSKEYTSRMALAKLDGSFDKSAATTFKDYPSNHAHQGQHRQAAETILKSFESEKAAPEFKPEDEASPELQLVIRTVMELHHTATSMNIEASNHIEQLEYMAHMDIIDTDVIAQSVYRLGTIFKELQLQASDTLRLAKGLRSDLDDMARESRSAVDQLDNIEHRMVRVGYMLDDVLGQEGVARAASLIDQSYYDKNVQLELRSSMPHIVEKLRTVIAQVVSATIVE